MPHLVAFAEAEAQPTGADEGCERVLVPVEQRWIAQFVGHTASAVDREPADALVLIDSKPRVIAAGYV